MRFDTLPAWLDYLLAQHPTEIELGLQRVQQVADNLKLTKPAPLVVTVAGTNGKGSFVASLQALMLNQGLSVGSYTSPHILNFNERIQLAGVNASDAKLLEAFAAVDAAQQGVSLTYFEFTTLAALYIFNQQSLDAVILEVGLGGRLDAVNIIEPDWAVLTSIGLDHQDFLGNDLNTIAFEKLGVLREHTKLINLVTQTYPALETAKKSHEHYQLGQDFDYSYTDAGQWQLKDKKHAVNYTNLPDNGLSLASQSGALFLMNCLAKTAISQHQLTTSWGQLTLAGRFQRFQWQGVNIFLDVAHNPQAIGLLQQRLAQYPLDEGKKRIAIFSIFENKDAAGVIAPMQPLCDAWFLAESDNPRALAPHKLAAILHEHDINMISVSKNLNQAFARAKQLCQSGDQIVIFGSFMLAEALLPKLQRL